LKFNSPRNKHNLFAFGARGLFCYNAGNAEFDQRGENT